MCTSEAVCPGVLAHLFRAIWKLKQAVLIPLHIKAFSGQHTGQLVWVAVDMDQYRLQAPQISIMPHLQY